MHTNPIDDESGLPAAVYNYAQWGRRIVEEAYTHAGANLLFDSSIDEPTDLLREQINRCFSGRLTSRYRSTFAYGNPFVLDALAARYGVERSAITCTTGSSSGMAIICNAYLQPGTHAIIERPYFDFLPAVVRNRDAQVSFIDRSAPDYAIDARRLAELIRPETRLIVLTNLHNPSGALLDDSQLLALAAVAERAGVAIVVDEVYGDFVTNGARTGVAARLSPALISVNSLTKVYGLFSLKCGWIIAHEAARARINAVYDRFEFGLSKVAHTIAAAVLENMAPFEAHWRSILAAARPVVVEAAQALERDGLLSGPMPAHGCMYFPRLAAALDDVAVADWLWRQHNLAVAPGTYFGCPGHLRIGFGRSAANVADGMKRLHSGLEEYRKREQR